MIEAIVIIGVIGGVALFKINHPQYTWKCMAGVHMWYYSHEHQGMYHNSKKNEIVCTRRKIYKCTHCGIEKGAENKDWIK